jgi:hypothetical protein
MLNRTNMPSMQLNQKIVGDYNHIDINDELFSTEFDENLFNKLTNDETMTCFIYREANEKVKLNNSVN